jgi:hypothetical protein
VATALAALLSGAVNAAADIRPADTAVPPAAPTGLATGPIGQTSIAVSWTAPTNTVGVTAYRLFRSGTQVAASTATTYTFVGLICGSTYTLSVAALGSGGHQSALASITANSQACTTSSGGGTSSGRGGTTSSPDTTAPSTPTGASAAATGPSTITLSWKASTDNVGVTGYRLSRAGSQVATSPTTSYTFTGLTCATSYTLGVSASDAAGNASSQATLSASTSACAATVPPAAGTASLWVAPSGSVSCRRAASPVGYAAAVLAGNVCDSGPTAYAKANLGDTVLIAGGTYTSSWNFAPSLSKTGSAGSCNYNYGGTASLSGCVSFAPAPGQSVVFQVAGQNTSAIRICADFVSIQGVTIAQTTYTDQFGDPVSNGSVSVGAGDNSCMPGGASPHDIYLANISYGGQASATGGASNVWFVGGTATGTSNFPWQMGGQGGNGATGYANHNGIVGITFQGASFISNDPAHHHMECVHDTPGSDHIVVASSRFISCPVESFFAQGTSQTNILVENNYFIGGGPLKFDCTTNPGCVNSGITVRYNSFASTFLNLQNACNAHSPCIGAVITNNVVYGNSGLASCTSVGFGLNGSTGTGWSFQGVAAGPCTPVSPTSSPPTTSITAVTPAPPAPPSPATTTSGRRG